MACSPFQIAGGGAVSGITLGSFCEGPPVLSPYHRGVRLQDFGDQYLIKLMVTQSTNTGQSGIDDGSHHGSPE